MKENTELAMRILEVVKVLSSDPAITDTVWMMGGVNVSAVDELCMIASKLGATDEQIEVLFTR